MREMRKGSGISGSWEGAWLLGETGKPQCVCVRERERERKRQTSVFGNNNCTFELFVRFPLPEILENSIGHFGERIDDKWSCCLVGAEVARTALSMFIGACWFRCC